MVCLACRSWNRRKVCAGCGLAMRPGGVQMLPGDLIVRSAFTHAGPARTLVLRLKYEGVEAAATWLAPHLAEMIEPVGGVLVPVPRTVARRIRYGVDTASVLAREVARLTGRRVRKLLGAPVWRRSNTGAGAGLRSSVIFFRRPATEPIILVDDVVTTGATLRAAAGWPPDIPVSAVTATRTLRVTSLLDEHVPNAPARSFWIGGKRGSSSPRQEHERGRATP